MTRPTCGSCPYWAPSQSPSLTADDKGECRIGRPEASANWPRTRREEFCGEHPDFVTWLTIVKHPE